MNVHKIQVGEKIAIVDSADAQLVRAYRWSFGGTRCRYIVGSAKGERIYLHRLVMGAGPGDIVDHANGDPLDNRRSNLRLVSRSENGANRASTTSATGYKGVAYWPDKKKYQARVCRDGKTFRGPYRRSAKTAAHDYDAMARGLFGDCCSFNFPRDGERGVEACGSAG